MYPACYIYKRTSDKGKELRYSIRSLQNVKNWNGEVFVAGDREDWFSDKIQLITDFKPSAIRHQDSNNRKRAIATDPRVPDDFIFMNDDFFCTSKTAIKALHQGELSDNGSQSDWAKTKARTRDYLIRHHEVTKPLDYDIHVPMIMNKAKLLVILDIDEAQPAVLHLAPRSLYGNLFGLKGSFYEDRKTSTTKLPDGDLLSTRIFSPELEKIFAKPSKFEKE